MPRLTITLSEEKHRALKEAAIKRKKTIGELIEESLDFYGIKSARAAASILATARRRSRLSEAEGNRLAVKETRVHRKG